jgi:hypothetical protein
MFIGLLNGLQNYEFLLITPNKKFFNGRFVEKIFQNGKNVPLVIFHAKITNL